MIFHLIASHFVYVYLWFIDDWSVGVVLADWSVWFSDQTLSNQLLTCVTKYP